MEEETRRIEEVRILKTHSLQVNIYDNSDKIVVSRELEELVKEMVVASMPLSFNIEALKCQSIIMRTNIIKRIKNFNIGKKGELTCKGIYLKDFPSWKPMEEYKEVWGEEYFNIISLIDDIVNKTIGEIIVFKDKPINARYHDVCGGSTENSENIDGNVVLYLRRVLCQYCEKAPLQNNYKDITLEEIEEKLDINFGRIDGRKNISIESMIYDIERDDTGRIISLNVAGKKFSGKDVKHLLNLESTKFSWQPHTIRFLSIGKGDGVGFCMHGGNHMAKEGKLAQDIIKYYYTGVEINKIQSLSINKPLLGKVIVIDPAHGGSQGEDHVSPKGLKEKELNLEIAFSLEKTLSKLGATIYLTRHKDNYVPITERAKVTNDIKPNFFLTIHQNFMKNSSVSGTEIYYYRGDNEAKVLGQLIMKEITEKLGMVNRGVKTAEFYLLRDINVSGLHIEVGYLSNPSDEEKLMNNDFKNQIAEAIAEAFICYFHLSY